VGGGFGVAGSGILAKVAGADVAPGPRAGVFLWERFFPFGETVGAGRARGAHLVAFERPVGVG
jgi:hypothetical protein